MTRRSLHLAALSALALGATTFTFGGWAVVTVDDLPDHLVVGAPTTLTFTVRQHGVSPLDGLSGSVVATTKNGPTVSVRATGAGKPGKYTASVVVPRAGDWTIAVKSGFGRSDVNLEPIAAVATAAAAKPLAVAERGQRLFVAKGCVTCHVHDGVEESGTVQVGPNLSPKRYQAEYLAKFLADPSIARTPGMQATMPNLLLKPAEITALVAFINGGGKVAARR